MYCSEAASLMSAAALGDLSGQELDDFEEHLLTCPSCHAELARARETLASLKDNPDAAVPAHLADRILAAGRSELRGRRSRRRLLGIAASVAAAGIAAFITWSVWRRPADRCTCWRFVGRDAGNSRTVQVEGGCVPERVLWERNLQGLRSAYRPLAWKDLVIVGTGPILQGRSGGGLIALDAESGRVSWSRSFSSGDFYKAKGFPDRCIQSGRIYLTDGERCIVIEAAAGRQLASLKPPEEAEGWGYLSASGPRLYGAARDGRTVFCIEAASGRVVWCRSVEGAVFVPALCDERVYLYTDRGTVAALDAFSGALVWSHGAVTSAGKGTVHARGERAVVLTKRGEILAFGAQSGEIAWRREVPGAFYSGLALGDEAVYVLAGSLALDLTDGRVLWRRPGKINGMCSAPTLAGEHVLAAAGNEFGSLSVYDLSGELIGTLENAACWACDGVIVSKRRAYTVGGGRVLALACASRG